MSCISRLGSLRVLPTPLAIESLPDFDAISGRFLAGWIHDKLAVRKTLSEQFLIHSPSDGLVDKVHELWMMNR